MKKKMGRRDTRQKNGEPRRKMEKKWGDETRDKRKWGDKTEQEKMGRQAIRKAAFAEKAALKSDLIHFERIGERRKKVSV